MKTDTDSKTDMATEKRTDKTVGTGDKDSHDNIELRSEKVRNNSVLSVLSAVESSTDTAR